MKRILYGAGKFGESVLNIYGKENVAYFFDQNTNITNIQGISVIHDWEKLRELQTEYLITIAVDGLNIYSVIRSLQQKEIKASWVIMEHNTVHVEGVFPDLTYTYKEGRKTNDNTVCMLKDMFNQYAEYYQGRKLDYWIYTGDYAHEANEIRKLLGIDVIFAYNTVFAEKKVIPIPDYMCYTAGVSNAYGESDEIPYSGFEKCLEAGRKQWVDERAFWAGTLNTAEVRRMLYHLSIDNEQKLCVNAAIRSNNGDVEFISGKSYSMLEFVKFKYLICVAGYGWADRLKHLLAMRRVVLLVEYPYREYYSDMLEPMVHYVPVKGDLSDLILKIEFLEENPDIYEQIVENATQFVMEHFKRNSILYDMNNIIKNNILGEK